MSDRIALIEAGASNLFNIQLALTRMGFTVTRVQTGAELVEFDTIVFPGVANFGFVCETLRSRGLDEALLRAIRAGRPYLGICVGLQVLYEASDEAPGVRGLGVLRGGVRRMRGPKNPQMGWNRVQWRQREEGVDDGWAYFANSYAAGVNAEGVVAVAEYGEPFAAVCMQDNVAGMQFHPERSGRYGLGVLERYLRRESGIYVS